MIRTKSAAVLMAFCCFLLSSKPLWAEGDILCASFPAYLFAKNVAQGRENYNIRLLGEKAAGCSHDYTPTPKDLEELSRADFLLISGLGFESFLAQALKVAKNDIKIIDASGGQLALSQDVGQSAPEILLTKSGFLHKYGGFELDHNTLNPHIFSSPSGASVMLENIAEAFSQLDEAGRDIYQRNAKAAVAEMKKSAAALKLSTSSLAIAPKVIAGHDIFEYMAKEAGFEIIGNIEEAEGAAPSAAHLAGLAALAKQQGAAAILIDPNGNVDMARALGAETKLPVAIIDPVASGPVDAPLDYYQKVMAADAQVLNTLFSRLSGEEKNKTGVKK